MSRAKSKSLRNDQRIYVNRSLNMVHIKFIGFDMDHTLAPYRRDEFEDLAFRTTLAKFIDAGYPEELSQVRFDPSFLIRGLLVDRERGNVLKVDGHKYVKYAYHGHRPLTKEERTQLYNNQSYKAQDFLSVDTFFALSEVQLFVQIVDFMVRHPGRITKSYGEIYQDIRQFIDLSHQDGTIKNEVVAHPEKYIRKDKFLATTLVRLLDADKSLFLLTNSHYDYTNAIMEYILSDQHEEFPRWRDYWDVIVVGAGKPGFFLGSQPFLELDPDTEMMRHHDGPLHPAKIYSGGNAKLFEKLNGYRGDEILYVGDHIYGDIMQSKGTLNWRTLLIIEELTEELSKLSELRDRLKEINRMIVRKERQDEEYQRLRSIYAANNRQAVKARKDDDSRKVTRLVAENAKLESELGERLVALKKADHDIRGFLERCDLEVHPIWGELMKVGLEASRFANQVTSYACMYTPVVSNLRFYNPSKKFFSTREIMPHEVEFYSPITSPNADETID